MLAITGSKHGNSGFYVTFVLLFYLVCSFGVNFGLD